MLFTYSLTYLVIDLFTYSVIVTHLRVTVLLLLLVTDLVNTNTTALTKLVT